MATTPANPATLPCPFCRGTLTSYQQAGINWSVRCEVCGAQCGPSHSEIAARENWNLRRAEGIAASRSGAGEAFIAAAASTDDPVAQMFAVLLVAREHDALISRKWVEGWAEAWQAERAALAAANLAGGDGKDNV